MFLHLVYEEHYCNVIKTEGLVHEQHRSEIKNKDTSQLDSPTEGAVCVCVCACDDTSSVQLSVQEGQSSGDTMSHPAAGRPVHCVDRQVVGQAALRQTERERDLLY